MYSICIQNSRMLIDHAGSFSALAHRFIKRPARAAATQIRYGYVWAEFVSWASAAGLELPGISEIHVEAFLEFLLLQPGHRSRYTGDRHPSGRTIRAKISVLNAIYSRAQAAGLISQNPFFTAADDYRRVRCASKRETEAATNEEVEKLIGMHSAFTYEGRSYRAILAAMFGCGMRAGEAIRLRLNSVRVSEFGPYFYLDETKSGRARSIAIPPWAKEIISTQLSARKLETTNDQAFLFPERKRHKPIDRPMNHITLLRRFKSWCAAVGIERPLTLHSGRATFVTSALRAGADIRDVRDAAGHATVTTTEKYDKRRKAIEQSASRFVKYW